MNCTGRFSDPHQGIIPEIGLFDSAIAHCDRANSIVFVFRYSS
jgi:hypothetical protein